MTYWCYNCKEGIDSDIAEYEKGYTEFDGRLVRDDTNDMVICPHCGEELEEEADMCKVCGDPVAPFADLCPDCKENVEIEIEQKIDELALDFGLSKEEAIDQFARWIDERG